MSQPDIFKKFIIQNKWIFAKTYADFAPHEYLVKGRLTIDDQKVFEEFVIFIRENWYKKMFGKTEYTYFDIDDNTYWTMWSPLEQTIILNRAKK
jgi:hypothetical protein